MFFSKRRIGLISFTTFCSLLLLAASVSAAPSKYYSVGGEDVAKYVRSIEGRKAIMIYATRCGYCRKALPKVIAIARSNPGKLIAVSVDQDPSSVRDYFAGYLDIPFPIMVHNKGISIERAFRVPDKKGVPHYLLIDEKGRVVRSATMSPAAVQEFLSGGS